MKIKNIVLSAILILSLLSTVGCSNKATESENPTQSEPTEIVSSEQSAVSSEETVSAPEETVSNNNAQSGTISSLPEATVSSETSVVSEPTVSSKPEISSKPIVSSKPEVSSDLIVNSKPAHSHSFSAATCTAPAKCSCGKTQGEALGHKFAEATCTAPKTCSVCNVTEGTALGHTFAEATCSAPKTCTVCKATEGTALAHTFYAGSCKVCKADNPEWTRVFTGNKMYSIAVPSTVAKYFMTDGHFNEDDVIYAVIGGEDLEWWAVSFIELINFFTVDTVKKDDYLNQSLGDTDDRKRILVSSKGENSVICDYTTSLDGLSKANEEQRKDIHLVFDNAEEIIASFRWEK